MIEEAETIARADRRDIDSPGYASNYRDVLLGLTDAVDLANAEALLKKKPELAKSAQIQESFAVAYARGGHPAEAAATLAKVPRFEEGEKRSFLGSLTGGFSQRKLPSQQDRAHAVRRTAFGLAQAGQWDALPAWIDALPTAGDQGVAALGVAEFLLRGRFADHEPP
jgi:hypothetical protein